MSRRIIFCVIALILIAGGIVYFVAMRPGDTSDSILADHAKAYDDLVDVESAADKAVREYTAPVCKLTDLDTQVAPIIKSMPVVKDVRVTGPTQPTKRIIQVCDWHLVPKDAFHIDQEHVRGKPVTRDEREVARRA